LAGPSSSSDSSFASGGSGRGASATRSGGGAKKSWLVWIFRPKSAAAIDRRSSLTSSGSGSGSAKRPNCARRAVKERSPRSKRSAPRLA
jgi:hypothetical protein